MPQGPGVSQGTISSQSAEEGSKRQKSRKARGALKGTGTTGEGATYTSGVGSFAGSNAQRRITLAAPQPLATRATERPKVQVRRCSIILTWAAV